MIIPRLNSIGGGEKFFLECAIRWQKKNDLTLYTTSLNEDIIKEFKIDSQVKIVDNGIKNKEMNWISLMYEMKKLSNKIGNHEIYNSHLFPSNILNIHPTVWIPQEPPRMFYDSKDYLLKKGNLPLFKKLSLSLFSPFIRYINLNYTRSDEIVANSFYSKKYLEKIYKREVKGVVYPGVDFERFKIKKGKDNVILVVSRLYPEKRIELAIKSLQYLKDHVLWIVGTGPYEQTLKKIVSSLGLEKRVKFWGNVKEVKLLGIYADCFCTIFTPLREPFGMVALESMAAGKPIIACKEGGFTEIMEDNKHGFLIDPEPQKIAEKVIYLTKNKDFYLKMSKNCINQSKMYSWDKTAKLLLNILKSVSI